MLRGRRLHPEELKKIAVRLTYSVCGFGAHKCTSLHGIAASGKTLDALLGFINEEMNSWQVADRAATDDKVVSPLMVHKAQTLVDIVAEAKNARGHRHPRGRPGGRGLWRALRGGEAGPPQDPRPAARCW